MKPLGTRRRFLATASASAISASALHCGAAESISKEATLRLADLTSPLLLHSIDLLKRDGEFVIRVRTTDGSEGVAVGNSAKLAEAYPVFSKRVAPFFVGKDAREIESLIDQLYRHRSSYKLQGLLYWVCVAALEMAVLDLLGKASDQSIGQLFGGVQRTEIPVYPASSNRGNLPEQEIEHLQRLVSAIGAKAVKFRARRSHEQEPGLPGGSNRATDTTCS